MYLVDSNVFLEILLDQERAQDAVKFFATNDVLNITISELSLYSIGIILFRHKRFHSYQKFISDIEDIKIVSVPKADLRKIEKISTSYNLDFDDAYQYLCCKIQKLELVSFDKDFDKSDLKRIEPSFST